MAWYWQLFIILIALIGWFYLNNSEKAKMQRIESTPGYTVGIIIKYNTSRNPVFKGDGGLPASVNFDYQIDGTTYSNRIEEGNGFNYKIPEDIKKNSKYIVIYEKGKPEESYLLFDYPIRKQGDFERYLKELKTHTPQIIEE